MARDGKYMDNKWKVKFPKIYKEKLQMADIGGIGNITYKKVVKNILVNSWWLKVVQYLC